MEDIREANEMADMAFYAYRDLNRTESAPFILAALERNPVSIEESKALEAGAALSHIHALPDESIYDDKSRLAQPDEVWNYKRGDGIEKALLFANILRDREPQKHMTLEIFKDRVLLRSGSGLYDFSTRKELNEQIWELSPS